MKKQKRFAISFFSRLVKSLIALFFVAFAGATLVFAENAAIPADKPSAASSPLGNIEDEDIDGKLPTETGEMKMNSIEEKESGAPKTQEESPEAVEQTAYPNVTNKVLERGSAGEPAIKLYYPAFGNDSVDASIKTWLDERVAYYDSLVKESSSSGDTENSENPEDEAEQRGNWEMTGFYTIEKPKPDTVSILFNIYAYTGGAHGNLWLYALNYNLESGKAIQFDNLFEHPQKGLDILSSLSITKLRQTIGEDTDDEWLERGAGPERDNFSVLTLVPDGLYAEFQPYQVGPWAIGPQRVFISLADLKEAGPSAMIWNLPPENKDTPEAKETENEEKEAKEDL